MRSPRLKLAAVLALACLAVPVSLSAAPEPASAPAPRDAPAGGPPRTRDRHHHSRPSRPPRPEADRRRPRSANDLARSYPTPDAYINSTLYYDYEAGRLYEVETSPHFLTAIILRPGEKLLSKAAGDTVRWVLGETAQGAGANQQVVVLLKPIRGGLRTNIVLTTDQRTYMIEASSHDGGAYTSAVSWNYPQEQMQALAAAQAAAQANLVAVSALPIDQLHFGYKIEPIHCKPPRWQPLRAFDDGTRTYIQFPVNMASTDAPPLFLVGPHDTADLVNYRYINGYYVVDRLIDVAELRIGEKPQTIVRITRTQGG